MTPPITVKVAGCVRCQGEYVLSSPATAWDAIQKAGGFGRRPYPPTGVVTIRSRRKGDGLYYKRRRFEIGMLDARRVQLRDRDLIVIQYDVNGQPDAAGNSRPGARLTGL